MAFRNLLQSSFMQSILSFIPAMRHSIESSPQQAEAPTPPPAPAASVEPWKEEVDRWKLLADKTTAERDQLRQEAGRLHVEMQRLVQDLGQVRVEAEELWKTQEEELRRERDEALRATEEQLQRERDEAVKKTEEMWKLHQDELRRESEETLRATQERLQREREEAARMVEENVQKAQENLQALASEMEERKREQKDLQAVLETRQVQLEELQLVVGSDKLGTDEVMQLLTALNEEISRTAKSVKDLFKLDRNSRSNGKVALEAASAIEGWVGSALPGLLSTQYRGNPVLLQSAFQAMAVAFSSWISSSYSFMHEHDQILDETYKYVMNSENQIVLGRWRALTHKYAKQGMPNLEDELTKMLVTDVRNLMIVAGSSTTQTETLISRSRDSLRSIVNAAIKLRTAIGEDIISCDFETILIHPGDIFDGTSMEDAYVDVATTTTNSNAKNVLCTSGLGLRRCLKRKVEGDASPQWEITVLQKPQVVLHSAVGQ